MPLDPETPTSAALTAAAMARIRTSGLKLTPQRLAIVRELVGDPSHPTAQELFERLRPVLPGMSFATVYNTLDTLAEKGLCCALALAPGPTRFDANMHPHDHLVCDACGLVRDVHREEARSVSEERQDGFHVRAIEQIYRGLCSGCAEPGPQHV